MEQSMPTSSTSNREDGTSPATAPARQAANGAATACFISKVKEEIREIDPSEYEPHTAAIGPYFRFWDKSIPAKRELLERALPPGSHEHRAGELRRYVNEMMGLVDRAKRCYAPPPEEPFSEMRDDDEEIACMLLLDGLFVVSWFVLGRDHGSVPMEKYDDVVRDVFFILENQVPFFVLEKVYELVQRVTEGGSAAVLDSVTAVIRRIMESRCYATGVVLSNDPRPCHLLHLLHMHLRPAPPRREGRFRLHLRWLYRKIFSRASTTQAPVQSSAAPEPDVVALPWWRAAVYYRENGVRLRARRLGSEARSVLDVELRGGDLHIPCLTIDDETWTILRNLVALEQHNPRVGSYVTAYCVFMSQLARRVQDVELLSDKGIIVHLLGSNQDVATGFSQLCTGVVFDINNPATNYLRPTWEAVERVCRSRRRRSMAWMRHTQCKNYCMALALLVATIVFICTVVQALFSVLSYMQQTKS